MWFTPTNHIKSSKPHLPNPLKMKQPPKHDYYAILGVSKSADIGQIKKAYRQLAQTHHPDRAGESGYIVLINEAYATLKDPKKRAKYDVYHAVYFSTTGKIAHKVATTARYNLQKSPTVMANLKKLERQATAFAQFAEHELKPVFIKNAKTLFGKFNDLMATHTPNANANSKPNFNPNANHSTAQTTPTLVITPELAIHGGQITFTQNGQTIRTTLPQGLTDGSQIKLTMGGVAVWFVVRVQG